MFGVKGWSAALGLLLLKAGSIYGLLNSKVFSSDVGVLTSKDVVPLISKTTQLPQVTVGTEPAQPVTPTPLAQKQVAPKAPVTPKPAARVAVQKTPPADDSQLDPYEDPKSPHYYLKKGPSISEKGKERADKLYLYKKVGKSQNYKQWGWIIKNGALDADAELKYWKANELEFAKADNNIIKTLKFKVVNMSVQGNKDYVDGTKLQKACKESYHSAVEDRTYYPDMYRFCRRDWNWAIANRTNLN